MSRLPSFLDDFVPRALKRWQQPGVAVAVVERNRQPYVRGFGERRAGSGLAVDADTLFGLASCSKTFAAVSVALLVDDSKLAFDDRVVEHLPWFELADPAVTAGVTVRDLLCNRLGLSSSEGRHRQAAANRRDLLERMRYQAFRHPFREQYGYCTDAFTVAGEVVTALAGQDWASFVRERLWQPLAMRRSNADHKLTLADANHAVPHIRQDDEMLPIDWIYEDHVATPAGGVNSSARELAHWLEFLLGDGTWRNRRILSAALLQELQVSHIEETGRFADRELASVLGNGPGGIEQATYALGLYRHCYERQDVYYHCGAIDGFRSIVGFVPGLDLGIAVMANADNRFFAKMLFQATLDEHLGGNGDRWHDAFVGFERRLDLARQAIVARQARTGGNQETNWLLPGAYRDDTGFGSATVRHDGSSLVLQVGALQFDLRPGSDGEFLAYKRWPYTLPPQFIAYPDTGAAGDYRGFRTSQDACFVLRGYDSNIAAENV